MTYSIMSSGSTFIKSGGDKLWAVGGWVGVGQEVKLVLSWSSAIVTIAVFGAGTSTQAVYLRKGLWADWWPASFPR
jgi:hypothetical protein